MEVKPQRILTSFKELKSKFNVFIIDLDGTLWSGTTPIPGTADATYQLLRDPAKKVVFYTNGGYCSLQYTFSSITSWLRKNLSKE